MFARIFAGRAAIVLLALAAGTPTAGAAEPLTVRLRSRVEDGAGRFAVVERPAAWDLGETAVIVCDMWDLHHCLNAVRRGEEMAPRMDGVLKAARDRGAVIVHAPSGCMDAYKDHPARKHALATPRANNLPRDIGQWCRQIPREEKGTYPIDQTDGGEDDDPAEHAAWAAKLSAMGRNPKAPWKSQTARLGIAESDYISDGGEEIWSILEDRKVKHVVLLGVHLNMCVLGRPFGLRQMAKNGRDVVLMRDLTDTMYNPQRAPYVNHYAGTDLMVEHVEKYVCPTVTSDQWVGGTPFHFQADRRPRVLFVIAEDEYKTEASLPSFASAHLLKDFHVSFALGDETDRDAIAGLNALATADVAVISVRRRVLPPAQLDAIRTFVARGNGLVGIRTASHAFAPRAGAEVPAGHAAWPAFDAEVLGGNYHGHHGTGPRVALVPAPGVGTHPVLAGVDSAALVGHGSLYKVSPLAKSAAPLLVGSIPGQPAEPVAWINVPEAKGRVFYTSLGQLDDFAQPGFNRLLRNAIAWAAGDDATR
jgi:type 1 glutamine amidotransferase/nicotinamidase-related amidase